MSEPLHLLQLTDLFTEQHAYVLFVLLSTVGIYMMIANQNIVKKIIGLNMFQTGIFLFFVTTAYVVGGSSAVIPPDGSGGPFASPLPHVIVLTAIVVGVSLTAVGLALTIRLYNEYGTLRADALREVIGDE